MVASGVPAADVSVYLLSSDDDKKRKDRGGNGRFGGRGCASEGRCRGGRWWWRVVCPGRMLCRSTCGAPTTTNSARIMAAMGDSEEEDVSGKEDQEEADGTDEVCIPSWEEAEREYEWALPKEEHRVGCRAHRARRVGKVHQRRA